MAPLRITATAAASAATAASPAFTTVAPSGNAQLTSSRHNDAHLRRHTALRAPPQHRNRRRCLAVAHDTRASTERRLARIAELSVAPAWPRVAAHWLHVERGLAIAFEGRRVRRGSRRRCTRGFRPCPPDFRVEAAGSSPAFGDSSGTHVVSRPNTNRKRSGGEGTSGRAANVSVWSGARRRRSLMVIVRRLLGYCFGSASWSRRTSGSRLGWPSLSGG
jgi:hypothetical protein